MYEIEGPRRTSTYRRSWVAPLALIGVRACLSHRDPRNGLRKPAHRHR